MKHFILALGLFAAASAVTAVDVRSGRFLPPLALVDAAGVAAPARTAPAPWVLLVVAANAAQTDTALARLQPPAEGWQGKLVVAVQGDAAQLRALVAKYPQLAGVRWYRDADGSAIRSLKLPGMPALLAMDAKNQIAWQTNGLPRQPEQAQNLVRSWVQPAVAK